MPRASTLLELFEGLAAIEATVDPALQVYPLRPDRIRLPAIYNVIDPAQTEPPDTAHVEDSIVVGARVAVAHSDSTEDMLRLIELADRFVAVLDPALLDADGPLGGALVRRIGIQVVDDVFNEIPVLAIEFPIRARLYRRVA